MRIWWDWSKSFLTQWKFQVTGSILVEGYVGSGKWSHKTFRLIHLIRLLIPTTTDLRRYAICCNLCNPCCNPFDHLSWLYFVYTNPAQRMLCLTIQPSSDRGLVCSFYNKIEFFKLRRHSRTKVKKVEKLKVTDDDLRSYNS